ncbi:MAG: hypothetical protein A2487_02450 [Candidatus Raymondbacteria bacterium RifOxyC12_full_50_8]|uniref:Glycosyltransferase subfamily 4-like N-terminal domain-containing protein n=1 Tax=Candidatus Raymondbacteria bacterium RIFOXYD12_FULL_49_13 TaxID=1817890 RepID=A0A1F7FIF6_UNCRA|nr:MAG: hypothetical protein A2248_20995 [Candidatus Raymondbacteria bacterium RIFOXYA2_FULL_49_16]OGJ99538.1 MAG: hypothetical protein A2350_05560 [Candidatus Raymondbacteria bacterium RifOxyB12_full_50_8]OGK06267.1 MAG: hypothetical protein A2519_08310 [Candidatus Raymondbacteria bacterium RIFOXYD12_FULL_49_13]OGK07723.1 MAG: hypothetical protein A2487_02450 [Candidatus Raymondbacteria bacterium RifOxyC12_full_50_8]OGP40599.1 MAG: hypothetical protein A2324_03065 [Candidatus Raymondbacteria b
MKILFANATRTWGGVKTWTLNLVRAFAESGISSIVCCRRTDPLLARCAEAGALVEPFTFGMDYNPLAMIRAYRILKKHRPSCIVTNISKELRIFGPIARALGIPVVARLGLSTDLRNNTRTRLEYRNLVRAILVPSHAIARDLPREIIGATPIQVVHNGVVVSNRTSWDSDARPVRTVFLGKLIERKGIAAILEAVSILIREGEPVEAEIIGDGAQADELHKRYGAVSGITFSGYCPMPRPNLLQAHIGVCNSSHEGFPNTLLEYMAAGLAIVTTEVDGISEMLVNGREALFVSCNNVPAITEALRNLVRNPALRTTLAQAAHARAIREFSINGQAAKIASFFRSIAKP